MGKFPSTFACALRSIRVSKKLKIYCKSNSMSSQSCVQMCVSRLWIPVLPGIVPDPHRTLGGGGAGGLIEVGEETGGWCMELCTLLVHRSHR